jgi:hypothetical protein
VRNAYIHFGSCNDGGGGGGGGGGGSSSSSSSSSSISAPLHSVMMTVLSNFLNSFPQSWTKPNIAKYVDLTVKW